MIKETNWKELGMLALFLGAVVFLWNTPVIYPLKILVVFFHELSHGIAGKLTGGEVAEIRLVKEEGGLCMIAGGNTFIILSAGYLGSLIWGGVILTLAARTRLDKALAVLLGLILAGTGVLLVRPLLGFGFFFCLGTGAALIACGIRLPRPVNEFILKLIGLSSCLYAPLDIKSDILDRPSLRSDAYMLAELTGIPTIVWGGLWFAVAVLASLYFLFLACRKPAENAKNPPKQTPPPA